MRAANIPSPRDSIVAEGGLMEDPKSPAKSLALPIAAGFLIGTAIFHVLGFFWGQAWGLRNLIDWDMIIKLGDRVRLDCGGCVSTVMLAALAVAAAFALIKFSQK